MTKKSYAWSRRLMWLNLVSTARHVLSLEIINDSLAKFSRTTMRERKATPPKISKKSRTMGGFAAHFACGFFEFWGVEFRFLLIFSEEFAKLPLILARDNSLHVEVDSTKHKEGHTNSATHAEVL